MYIYIDRVGVSVMVVFYSHYTDSLFFFSEVENRREKSDFPGNKAEKQLGNTGDSVFKKQS